jgi:hypothetical protein
MTNGRPDESTHCAFFNPENHKQHIISPIIEQDAPGYLEYSGHVNKENRILGKGKCWYDDGDIYIGEWINGDKNNGKRYKL